MKTFLQPLQNLAEMEEIQKQAKKNRGILEISGCMESQKAHLMYGLSGLFPCHLVIAADEKSAKELYEDYRFYDKRVYYYPAKDLLFFQADIHGNLLIRQRMQVIRALLEREDEITVVTSIDGCMDYLAPLEKIEKQLIHFRNDSALDMDKLTAALVHMGYERVGQVEMPGQFSIRGGIIDIYSLTEENPWRIELWGDEIDSIRSFDAQSQRSLENLDDVTIYPAAEQPMEKNGVSFLDYFKETETLFFLDELNHLEENAKAVQEEFQQSCENRKEKGEISLSGDIRPFAGAQMEFHKKYCDLQYIVSGNEKIYWLSLRKLTVVDDHTEDGDYLLYESGVDQGYTLMERGMFGFYAPEDGHMPSIAVTDPEPVTKIVFKIPVK